MNKQHLNYVAIKREGKWYIFERMGKQIPFELYPLHRNLGEGNSSEEAIKNSTVPNWNVEVIE